MRIAGDRGRIDPKVLAGAALLAAIAGLLLVFLTRTRPARSSPTDPVTQKENLPNPVAVDAPATPSAASGAPPSWLRAQWDSTSFAAGLVIAADPRGGAAGRAMVIQRLASRKRALSPEELVRFRDTLRAIIQNQNEDPALRAGAIHALSGVAILLAERNGAESSGFASEYAFLIQFSGDAATNLAVRGEAVRALGDLKLNGGLPVIEALLSNPASRDEPLLARNACLSLQKLLGVTAVPQLATVLETTQSEPVFGAAAFALSQTQSPDAVGALVANRSRFPDSGSCDAALSELAPVVLTVLRDPNHPQIVPAVHATESLWREGQSDLYRPALHQLLRVGPLPARKPALERLLKVAASFDFEREKQELVAIQGTIVDQPEFQEQQAEIARRLTASVVQPTSGLRGPPVVPKP